MKRIILSAMLGLAVGSYVAPPIVSAVPTLQITDGSTTVTVADGSGSDLNGLVGAVTFSGSVGVWILNVSTGVTYPVLGAASQPHMDLNSVNVSTPSGVADTLTIRFSEIGYSNPLGSFHIDVGGTVSDSVGSSLTYQTFLSATNSLFGTTTPLSTLGPFASGAFSGTASSAGGGAGPFSLTQVVTITHPAAAGGANNSTSFNAELTSVPEPTSMVLLGSGLLGLGLWGRKRMQS